MPIYEYRCKACEKRFELLRAFGQKDADATCPTCGGVETRRELSVSAPPVTAGESSGCGWSPSAGACLRPGCGSQRN